MDFYLKQTIENITEYHESSLKKYYHVCKSCKNETNKIYKERLLTSKQLDDFHKASQK